MLSNLELLALPATVDHSGNFYSEDLCCGFNNSRSPALLRNVAWLINPVLVQQGLVHLTEQSTGLLLAASGTAFESIAWVVTTMPANSYSYCVGPAPDLVAGAVGLVRQAENLTCVLTAYVAFCSNSACVSNAAVGIPSWRLPLESR
jgi:hypothetical protein